MVCQNQTELRAGKQSLLKYDKARENFKDLFGK